MTVTRLAHKILQLIYSSTITLANHDIQRQNTVRSYPNIFLTYFLYWLRHYLRDYSRVLNIAPFVSPSTWPFQRSRDLPLFLRVMQRKYSKLKYSYPSETHDLPCVAADS